MYTYKIFNAPYHTPLQDMSLTLTLTSLRSVKKILRIARTKYFFFSTRFARLKYVPSFRSPCGALQTFRQHNQNPRATPKIARTLKANACAEFIRAQDTEVEGKHRVKERERARMNRGMKRGMMARCGGGEELN